MVVSCQLAFTKVPVDYSVTPSRGSLRTKVRLTGLMALGSSLSVFFPFSAVVLWPLLCLPQVLRGNCKWFTGYFGELLQNLLNYMTPYEFE